LNSVVEPDPRASDLIVEPVGSGEASGTTARAGSNADRIAGLKAAREGLTRGTKRSGSAKNSLHRWTRVVHVYTSMISLLVVLFFSLTGITLNHPDWAFGTKPTRQQIQGTLPANAFVDGKVDWLNITEFLRNTHGVRGAVTDRNSDELQGSVSFRQPGYGAQAFFDVKAKTFDLTVEQQGLVGVMNDMHKGRDSGSSWRWLIDVSGGLLVLISLTGLGLQFFLRKRRRSAFATVGIGIVVVAVLAYLTLR
jgi:uncharacterized protein